MDARWFLCYFFAAVLFSEVTQGQVIGRMRHVASPGPESCNTLDDLFSLLSLARALEEKSTGRLSSTYCPDDVIINLVNALVYTATAHVCPEPWTPTAQPHSQLPHLPTCPPTTYLPPTTYPPATSYPPTTTYLPPATTTNPPSTLSPPTMSSPSNISDYFMKPVDNGDFNQNDNVAGVSKNAQVVVVDVEGNHHPGVDNGKNNKSDDDGSTSHRGDDEDEKTQTPGDEGDNTQKGTEDSDYSLYGVDIGGSQHLDFVKEKKVKSSKKSSGHD